MSLKKPIKYLYFFTLHFPNPFSEDLNLEIKKRPPQPESASHILFVLCPYHRPELIPINPIQQKIIIFTSRFDEKASHVLI
jgi:hypothetical protein